MRVSVCAEACGNAAKKRHGRKLPLLLCGRGRNRSVQIGLQQEWFAIPRTEPFGTPDLGTENAAAVVDESQSAKSYEQSPAVPTSADHAIRGHVVGNTIHAVTHGKRNDSVRRLEENIAPFTAQEK